MRGIKRAFEAKIIQQTHVNLRALKEEIYAKVDLRSAALHWNPEVELSAKVDLRSDALQGSPEAEISYKLRKNLFKGSLNIVIAINIEERVQ